MAESKSDQFPNNFNTHSEKIPKFDSLSTNRVTTWFRMRVANALMFDGRVWPRTGVSGDGVSGATATSRVLGDQNRANLREAPCKPVVCAVCHSAADAKHFSGTMKQAANWSSSPEPTLRPYAYRPFGRRVLLRFHLLVRWLRSGRERHSSPSRKFHRKVVEPKCARGTKDFFRQDHHCLPSPSDGYVL